MKSFSAFITERRTKGGRTGNMKFPGDDAYRKMQDELSKKEKTKSKTVKQSEVSQQAKDYRTAQGEKRYQAAKTDVEVRRGFQTGKGGLKADESNPYVNREVRQQRAVKQGVSDNPWLSSTKASSNPFEGLRTGNKPQGPDPFGDASSVPEPRLQGPEQKLEPGPAEREARRNIRAAQERIDKTKPGTVSNMRDYVKSQTKGGYKISPELEDALLFGRRTRGSGTEERIGGSTAPSRKPRTSGKPASAAVNRARASGDFRAATTDFTGFSRKATSAQKKYKADNPSLSPAGKSTNVRRSSALTKQFGNPLVQGAFDAFMGRVDKAKVKVDEPKAISGGKPALPGDAPIKPVEVKVDEPPKSQKPPKPSKPPRGLSPARKAAATSAATSSQAKNAPLTQAGLNKSLRRFGGRALGVAGAGYDAYTNFQDYKKSGDSDWRAGAKSAFRTGLGYAGGALGGLAGGLAGGGIGSAVLGTAGAIGGYSAGTALADKVLGITRYERKKKARAKAAAAAANQK